jgi:hypothetical protein
MTALPHCGRLSVSTHSAPAQTQVGPCVHLLQMTSVVASLTTHRSYCSLYSARQNKNVSDERVHHCSTCFVPCIDFCAINRSCTPSHGLFNDPVSCSDHMVSDDRMVAEQRIG